MKKEIIFLLGMLLLAPLVLAQTYKIDISTIPEDKLVNIGGSIQIKVDLRDENNLLVSDSVQIKIQDLRENLILEKSIQSNVFEEIKIPENVLAGEGKIIATYQENQVSESLFIQPNEKAKFEIKGEELIVTNIGNTVYEKEVYITIGETTGVKTPSLGIGKSISYRLIAPEGVYNIKVTDKQDTLSVGEVRLTGTGQVIGAIDKSSSQGGITGGIRSEGEEQALSLKSSKFIYVFVATIFGAMILLTIERRYRKKIKAN